MSEYRWNVSDFAASYDKGAERIHPYYLELQDEILGALSFPPDASFLLVDAGGGSGRLVQRVLEKWPRASGVVLDQSEPFLALAERRLAKYAKRATCIQARLQEDWPDLLPKAPLAIVSMSAVHHLDPAEKAAFYRRCFEALAPGGVLLNGDEVRPDDDAEYLAVMQGWSQYMERAMQSGTVPAPIHPNLRAWSERNVARFGELKRSGDDCHETAAAQLGYLRSAGFPQADAVWCQKLWTLLAARK